MRLLPLFLLCGCTLVDQRTFNPVAGIAPVVAARAAATAPAAPGPPALLTLRMPGSHDAVIREAVAAARARKRDVAFDVQASVPLEAVPSIEGAAAADAATVARAIVAAGVAQSRVRLTARPEAGADPREVKVYAR